ncbi:MAG: DUF2207 domain-containing protein [Hyphomonadaceae bacterium]
MKRIAAVRAALLVLLAALFAVAAQAEETINRFDVHIEVQKNGDIIVTENIDVNAEGARIRRGIFRDLPRTYTQNGDTLPFRYDVLDVKRDDRPEPYETSTEGNAWRIQIGDPDVYLTPGEHAYQIRYRVKNQVRYFDSYDEIYWNATGTYWAFPILAARAEIVLPPGGQVVQTAAYTGALGATGQDFTHTTSGDAQIFEATRRLEAGEGLTVSIGFAKGLIDPPSGADKGWLWWQRNGSMAILITSLLGIFWFLFRSFDRVGRDPPRQPVFPRYAPPEGYTPGAVHQIYYRGTRGHQALIATLMNLAIKGQLEIDATEKKTTTLTRAHAAAAGLAPEEELLEKGLFSGGAVKTLGDRVDTGFVSTYSTFRQSLSRRFGSPYFKWNALYTVLGVLITIVGVAFAIKQALNWTIWHTALVLALAGINLLFMYLMPAPTAKGQKIRAEIEGFRLYMETAEKLQLNAAEVGGEKPPPMTKERYETFLPFAIALGVEKPWTNHFERLLPEVAKDYSPGWARFSGSSRSLHGLNESIMGSISSGVSGAMPQSSGSSGSGGGGFSGGGGGGGGGGGW